MVITLDRLLTIHDILLIGDREFSSLTIKRKDTGHVILPLNVAARYTMRWKAPIGFEIFASPEAPIDIELIGDATFSIFTPDRNFVWNGERLSEYEHRYEPNILQQEESPEECWEADLSE